MANGIRTGDPRGFNKGRSSKFHVRSWVRQRNQPKRCGNKNKDEDNSPNGIKYYSDRISYVLDVNFTNFITSGQSGPGSYDNEGILQLPKY